MKGNMVRQYINSIENFSGVVSIKENKHILFEEAFGYADIANERNIPLVWISHDLIDPRAIPRNEMRKQFNDFMFSVMNEKPLDESLLDFDDSKGW